MSDDNKAAQEANEAEATEDAVVEATDEQTTEDKQEAEPSEESKQFKAQLAKEKQASDAKDKIIADQAFKLRKKNREEEDGVVMQEQQEIPEGEQPVTRAEFHTLMAQQKKTEIEAIVSNLSDDDEVRQLIKFTHKNRSYPSNISLTEQLAEAYLVANKNKILGQNSEMKRALSGKARSSKGGGSTHHDGPPGTQPKMKGPDAAEYARVGYKWNPTSKLYEKQLSSGKKLTKNPKTKQTRVI